VDSTEITFAILRLNKNPRLGHANHKQRSPDLRSQQSPASKVVTMIRDYRSWQLRIVQDDCQYHRAATTPSAINRDRGRHRHMRRKASRSVRSTEGSTRDTPGL